MSETDHRPVPRRDGGVAHRSEWLVALPGIVAITALGGALGLITGVLDLGTVVTARMPFHSPVLAGVALAVTVGAPMATVTWLAGRRDLRAGPAAVLAGSWLIGWTVVEFGVIRATSWVQALLALSGLLVLLVGLRETKRS